MSAWDMWDDRVQETLWTEEQEGLLLDWANVLINGGRTQGKDVLRQYRDGVRHECCLGVACDVFKERVDGFWLPYSKNPKSSRQTMMFVSKGNFEGEACHLPIAIRKLLGLDYQGKVPQALGYYLVDGREYETLEEANDASESFSAIGMAIVAKVRLNRERRTHGKELTHE